MTQSQNLDRGQTKDERGYIVRVELHGIENPQEYQYLHEYMRAAGFQTIISNRDGMRFKLPTATYYHHYLDYMPFSSGIHELALAAVRKAFEEGHLHIPLTIHTPSILVAYAQDTYWTGLELADENDK